MRLWILDLRNRLPVWMNRILFPLNLLGLLFSSDTSPLTAFPVYVGSRTTPVVAPIFIMNSTEEIEMIKLKAFHSTILKFTTFHNQILYVHVFMLQPIHVFGKYIKYVTQTKFILRREPVTSAFVTFYDV